MSLALGILEIGVIGLIAILVVLLILIFREKGKDRFEHKTFVGLSAFIYFLLLLIPLGAAADFFTGYVLLMLLNTYWVVAYIVLWGLWFGGVFGGGTE